MLAYFSVFFHSFVVKSVVNCVVIPQHMLTQKKGLAAFLNNGKAVRKVRMIPRIRKRFLEIYDNPINTSSYRNYYIALCDFIKTNQSLIESDLLDKDLMQILNIDWFLSAKI